MFNVSDIVALAKAGYTEKQISAMAALQNAQPAAPAAPAQPAAPAAPAQPAAPAAPAQPAAPAAPAQDPAYTEILKQLGLISQNMQAAALGGTNLPPRETTEDILASIINPKEDK